uniref:DUF8039 domain-containing protein n=1 Tax=Lactuca sativa TaxID=4236 RepID=A0A9R1X664_LACSA|nr:hypothetical protein LSAT_V11C600329920 [Lactuca sativa]
MDRMVFPYNDGLIHSLPLRENHLKVMIDKIYERYKGIPVPVMTNKVGILEDAVRIEQQSKAPSQKQILTTSARPSTTQINKPRPIESLPDFLKINLVVYVVADAGHPEVGAFDFSVTYKDYYCLLKKQTTDLSIITTWQIFLGKPIRKLRLMSSIISLMRCRTIPAKVPYFAIYINSNLFFCLFILKFQNITDTHWVLLVIFPSNHIVYILDSLIKSMQNLVDNYYLFKLLEMAFERYEKSTSIPSVWKLTECNQAERELRGHDVMNWIFDFVLNRQHGFPSRFDTLWNDKTAFVEKALDSLTLRPGLKPVPDSCSFKNNKD